MPGKEQQAHSKLAGEEEEQALGQVETVEAEAEAAEDGKKTGWLKEVKKHEGNLIRQTDDGKAVCKQLMLILLEGAGRQIT